MVMLWMATLWRKDHDEMRLAQLDMKKALNLAFRA